MKLKEAIDAISEILDRVERPQVGKPEPKGEFVEFEIYKNSYFAVDNRQGFRSRYNWQNYVKCEIENNLIFAGWKFPLFSQRWSQYRWGISGNHYTTDCAEWEKPIIPIKIRFYKKGE